jgi:hypothetical protein
VEVRNDSLNFISYVSDGKKRVVFYYFKPMEVMQKGGKTGKSEICVKYVSKNMCRSYTECPELDEVVRSLNSRFTPDGYMVWMDYSKSIPQQWIVVKEDHYFEVHVEEKKEKE